MEIKHAAIAGTLESSDVQVTLTPNADDNEIIIESSVYYQYGQHIEELITELIKNLQVEKATIKLVDKGALDCTIKARFETAFFRATNQTKSIAWKELL